MYIVFDIGGTNTRVATATKDAIGEIKKVPTPQNPEEGIAQCAALAHELCPGGCSAAGGSIAGRVSKDGVLSDARNLRAWEGMNVVTRFSAALNMPVRTYNDGIVVGLGEMHAGAGKGFSRVAYITVSTGVGGALVQTGAELAESPLLGDVALRVGDLENQVSGTAVRKRFGIHPKDLSSLEERNKLADVLAHGLVELNDIWEPEVFVLGGSMIVGENPIPLGRVRETMTNADAKTELKMAMLGDNGGLEGGRALVSQLR